MKQYCIMAGSKITIETAKDVSPVLAAFNTIGIPFYVLDNNHLVSKVNCSKENVERAKAHRVAAVAHKTVYDIVLSWWAGKQIVASYSSESEANRHCAERQKTYQGNGCLYVEERKITKDVELTKDVLGTIVDSYDGIHNTLTLKWLD